LYKTATAQRVSKASAVDHSSVSIITQPCKILETT